MSGKESEHKTQSSSTSVALMSVTAKLSTSITSSSSAADTSLSLISTAETEDNETNNRTVKDNMINSLDLCILSQPFSINRKTLFSFYFLKCKFKP